jgi:hypothetical protein
LPRAGAGPPPALFSYSMPWFPRPSSPLGALRDLSAFMRHRSREQLIGAALALLVTSIIVIEFVVDAKIGTAPPPQYVEAELYPSNRTDAEIIADQKKDQAKKEAAERENRRQYQKLENMFGM